jgi:hypothetical protein
MFRGAQVPVDASLSVFNDIGRDQFNFTINTSGSVSEGEILG